MKKNSPYKSPSSRYYKSIEFISNSILSPPRIELHIELYENKIIGESLAQTKFTKIKEYLKSEKYNKNEILIILSEIYPTLFGQGDINITLNYIDYLNRFGTYQKLTQEYKKSVSELQFSQKIIDSLIVEEIEKLTPKPNEKNVITMQQVALKLYYEYDHKGKPWSRESAQQEIEKFAWKSAEALYQKFNWYSKKVNRLASGETQKTFENKIKLFETVIEFVQEEIKMKVKDELNIIKSKGRKRFE